MIKLNGIYQSIFYTVTFPIAAYLSYSVGYKFLTFAFVYLWGLWTTALIIDYKKHVEENKHINELSKVGN